ncbi:MAG: hypothetical protein M3326_12300, partial [Actinomycetota bacterium]|nr:hypothetical protein [Actinomycetota bacterium]
MSTVAAPRARVRPGPGWTVGVVGVVALLARPWFLPAGVDAGWRVLFFVALGMAGAGGPAGRPRPAGAGTSVAVLV